MSDSVGSPTGTVRTTADYTGTPLLTSTKTLNGSGVACSDSTQLTLNDTYYWKVTYAGDGAFSPSESSCGTEQTSISGNTPGSIRRDN